MTSESANDCSVDILSATGGYDIQFTHPLPLLRYSTQTVSTIINGVLGCIGNIYALHILRHFPIRRTIIILLGSMAVADAFVCLCSILYFGLKEVLAPFLSRPMRNGFV